MSKIVAFVFSDTEIPNEIYDHILRMEQERSLDIADVAEVTIKDNGKLRFSQNERIALGTENRLFLPALIGLLFFHPLLHENERVDHALAEINLDNNFLKIVRHNPHVGSEILFLMLRNHDVGNLVAEAEVLGAQVSEITLSDQQEEALHRLFRGQAPEQTEMVSMY